MHFLNLDHFQHSKMRCQACFAPGHNARSVHCPMARQNQRRVFVVAYHLIERRIKFGNQVLRLRLPNIFHHAVVVDQMEVGYGRGGITTVNPGEFYGRRGRRRVHSYAELPPNYQFHTTQRIIHNMLLLPEIANRFQIGNYCVIHNNCQSFCQELVRANFRRNQRALPAEWPPMLEQYPLELVEAFLDAVNFFAFGGQIDHRHPHNCVFLS